MTFVVAQPCIDVKDRACVDVCPADCIHEAARILVIDPDECIDCGACAPECPVEAIFPEHALPQRWQAFVRVNYAYRDGLDRVNRLVDEYGEGDDGDPERVGPAGPVPDAGGSAADPPAAPPEDAEAAPPRRLEVVLSERGRRWLRRHGGLLYVWAEHGLVQAHTTPPPHPVEFTTRRGDQVQVQVEQGLGFGAWLHIGCWPLPGRPLQLTWERQHRSSLGGGALENILTRELVSAWNTRAVARGNRLT